MLRHLHPGAWPWGVPAVRTYRPAGTFSDYGIFHIFALFVCYFEWRCSL